MLVDKILHVNINVTNLERSIAFYERLGFAPIMEFAFSEAEAAGTSAAFGMAAPVAYRGVMLSLGGDPANSCLDLVEWARQPEGERRMPIVALADPSFVQEQREPLRDIVALVLDRSASQSIGVRRQQTDAAREAIEARLAALGGIEARVIESGRDGDSDGTRLFAALGAGLADVPPERLGGVIMVTDGVVHDIPDSVEHMGVRAPLHVLVTGHEGERDRRVELTDAPRFGIVGKDLTVGARVLDTGGGRTPVTVRVRRDGSEVATLLATPGVDITIPVRIDHGGPNVIEIEVAALPDELTTVNNRAVLTVDGVRDKLKVLLVSGEPHAGERMWRNLLRADANVDLVHFTILRPQEKQDGTPINELSLIAFPTGDLFGRKITDFDLIIFDRYSNLSVLPSIYLENVARYVREGGALMIAAGPDFARPSGLYYTPLGRIAPARPDGNLIETAFRASVSKDGEKHPVTRGLPGAASDPPGWSEWYRQIDAQITRGTGIMNGAGGKPLLVLSREGKGRVAELLSDQMWLWARSYEGGGPYLDLLRRTAHWLMKEPELEEEALRARAHGREFSIERQTLKDEFAPVTLTAPSGATETVILSRSAPGLASARTEAKELGLYRISDGDLSVLANVGPDNPREFQEVVSTTEHLAPLAQASGGTVRRLASGADSAVRVPRLAALRQASVFGGSDWIGIRRTDSSVVRGVSITPLAIGLIGLLALLACFLAMWAWEGRRA